MGDHPFERPHGSELDEEELKLARERFVVCLDPSRTRGGDDRKVYIGMGRGDRVPAGACSATHDRQAVHCRGNRVREMAVVPFESEVGSLQLECRSELVQPQDLPRSQVRYACARFGSMRTRPSAARARSAARNV